MILFNASNISVGGGIQVTLSMLNEINALNESISVIYVLPIELKNSFVENKNSTYVYSSQSSIIKRNTMLDKLVKRYNVTKVFSVFGPTYWKPKNDIFHLVGFALPWIVYEDSPIYRRLSFYISLKKRIYNFFRIVAFKREATSIWVETEDVKLRLERKILDKEIHVISNSVSKEFSVSCLPIEMPHKEMNIKYGLFLSHWYAHKNFEILFETNFEKFSNVRYIVTLTENDFERIPQRVKDFFINIGPVKPGQCKKLYEYCDFVVQPSFLECFSANLVEAMYCGKPLITSNLDFSTKLCQETAVYFDPTSPLLYNNALSNLFNKSEQDMNSLKLLMDKRLNTFLSPSDRARAVLTILQDN
ncbi:glycosyltransferase [Vibrio cyclitrophicus]